MQGNCLFGWDATWRKWRKILVNAEGKLIIDPSEILEDVPTDGEVGKAPTSNWAHDHAADPSAHHVKTTSAEIDHGSVQGLGDDDHTQYLNIARHDTTTRHPLSVLDPAVCSEAEADSKIATHAANPSAHHTKTTSAEIDHGSVQGLGDDDHTQYLNIARHDTTTRHPLSVLDAAVCSETECNSKISTHAANASAHHTRYTDKEACDAWHARSEVLNAGSWHNLNLGSYNRVYLLPITGNITIYSILEGYDGQKIEFVVPVSSYTITIQHNYTADGSGRRIMCANAANNTIAAGHVAVFSMVYYSSQWIMSQVVS